MIFTVVCLIFQYYDSMLAVFKIMISGKALIMSAWDISVTFREVNLICYGWSLAWVEAGILHCDYIIVSPNLTPRPHLKSCWVHMSSNHYYLPFSRLSFLQSFYNLFSPSDWKKMNWCPSSMCTCKRWSVRLWSLDSWMPFKAQVVSSLGGIYCDISCCDVH